MTCHHCKSPIATDDQFCGYCGAKKIVESHQHLEEETRNKPKAVFAKRIFGNKQIIILIIAVVVLVTLVGGCSLYRESRYGSCVDDCRKLLNGNEEQQCILQCVKKYK